ncbi:MAG: ABC transporter ATP-binding protein [Verrucomicrobiota bacterium]
MKASLKNVIEVIATAWRLRPHLRGGRHLVGVVVMSSLVAALLEGVGVSLLVPLLSLMMEGEGVRPMRPITMVREWIPGQSTTFYVITFCGLVLGAIAAKNMVAFISQMLAARLKRRISVNLRDAVYRKLQNAALSTFEHRTAGELANVCFGETSRTILAVDMLLLMGQRASIGFFYLMMILYISWQLTLLTILLALTIGGLVSWLHRQQAQRGKEVSIINEKLGSCLVECFAGIRVVRATFSQERELERFSELSHAQADIERKITQTNALLPPIAETSSVAGAMLITGFAYYCFVSTGIMLPTYLAVFGFILLRLLPLVNQLYGLQGNMLYLSNGVKEVERWLTSPHYPLRPYGKDEFTGVNEAIRLEDVSYTYENGTQALKGISLTIPAGRTVALVGASGSGKSTIATLLLRLRQPSGGKITVDGKDYWEFSPETWHARVAAVEQEAFLFHDSMARNIAYGYPDAKEQEITEAIQIAHLEDVTANLPEGLDTVVGERGTLLSGGQRQRLAIARAMVRNPRFLILDEATSALDNVSERQVQAALEHAVKGRTVLVIAHRLSTIRNADHIVVLDGGRVVEQGKWDDLVKLGGVFEKLVSLSVV